MLFYDQAWIFLCLLFWRNNIKCIQRHGISTGTLKLSFSPRRTVGWGGGCRKPPIWFCVELARMACVHVFSVHYTYRKLLSRLVRTIFLHFHGWTKGWRLGVERSGPNSSHPVPVECNAYGKTPDIIPDICRRVLPLKINQLEKHDITVSFSLTKVVQKSSFLQAIPESSFPQLTDTLNPDGNSDRNGINIVYPKIIWTKIVWEKIVCSKIVWPKSMS